MGKLNHSFPFYQLTVTSYQFMANATPLRATVTNYQLPYDAYASRLANIAPAMRAYTNYQLPITNYYFKPLQERSMASLIKLYASTKVLKD